MHDVEFLIVDYRSHILNEDDERIVRVEVRVLEDLVESITAYTNPHPILKPTPITRLSCTDAPRPRKSRKASVCSGGPIILTSISLNHQFHYLNFSHQPLHQLYVGFVDHLYRSHLLRLLMNALVNCAISSLAQFLTIMQSKPLLTSVRGLKL
jgi:hypothetical protein